MAVRGTVKATVYFSSTLTFPVYRLPTPYTRQRADSSHRHTGQSQAAWTVDSTFCFNFSFALWNGELGSLTALISVQGTGNKRFVQMFPEQPIDSSPASVVSGATRVRSHDSP